MSVRSPQRRRFLAAALLVGTAGCQAFDRGEYRRRLDGGRDGQGPDVARADAADSGVGMEGGAPDDVTCAPLTRTTSPSCTLAVIPSLPTGLRNRAGGTRVFAARRVTLGAGGEWMSIGFDRDGLCTVFGPSGESACRPSLTPLMDGNNGRDNTLGSVLGALTVLNSVFEEGRLNRNIEEGGATIGLRLRDYGGSDDGAIAIDVLPLVNGHPPGATMRPPAWDGRDLWSINQVLAYAADGRTPRFSTNEGFSSCGTLVMPFANTAPVYFRNDMIRSELNLTDLRIVGRVDAAGNLMTADLSALWARDRIFSDLRTFAACPERLSPGDWMALQAGISAALDLPATGSVNPNAECSAMSVAFRITWTPVTIEGDAVGTPPAVVDPCAP